jgi:hypothetical protein
MCTIRDEPEEVHGARCTVQGESENISNGARYTARGARVKATRGEVSEVSATGNGLIPSTAPTVSSLLRGRCSPSKSTGALHLRGYCRNPLTFRRRFMALGKWLWL